MRDKTTAHWQSSSVWNNKKTKNIYNLKTNNLVFELVNLAYHYLINKTKY